MAKGYAYRGLNGILGSTSGRNLVFTECIHSCGVSAFFKEADNLGVFSDSAESFVIVLL